ncbi:hypothetical protein HJC99_06315 [Candidatus Saccharibacteria bacterium]|nr:hypothetical protein [Candidatus Saccharibacteria bacterium]
MANDDQYPESEEITESEVEFVADDPVTGDETRPNMKLVLGLFSGMLVLLGLVLGLALGRSRNA